MIDKDIIVSNMDKCKCTLKVQMIVLISLIILQFINLIINLVCLIKGIDFNLNNTYYMIYVVLLFLSMFVLSFIIQRRIKYIRRNSVDCTTESIYPKRKLTDYYFDDDELD